jgi:hypothetical protein
MPGELEMSLLDFPDPVLPLHAKLRLVPGANRVEAFLWRDLVVPEIARLTAVSMAGP